MTGSRGLGIGVAGAAVGLALGAAYWVGSRGEPRAELAAGAAPRFALPVVAGEGADEGDRVALAAFRGRVVVLDFWATWCEPCADLAPRLSRLEHARRGDGLSVVGIQGDPGASPAAVRAAHRRFGASYPSVQGSLELLDAYGVSGFPTVLLLDGDGRIVGRWDGVPDFSEIERAVARALEATRGRRGPTGPRPADG